MYQTPFFDWDESIYAQSGREMIASKSYLIPQWQGQPWLDKPPLPSLIYGITLSIFPKNVEVATRLVNLFFSTITLLLIYLLYRKVTKDTVIALLAIVITAFVPSFLQRSQVLNVDVFLLMGWVGYVYFAANFRASLIFLIIGVLSKSLLGFYPPLMFITYYILLFLRKKISRAELFVDLKMRLIQIALASAWFVLMLFQYGNNFILNHFYESHFKRVSASIESHFGVRTFYIDLIITEMGRFIWLSIFGGIIIIYEWFKKKRDEKLFFSLFFIPWFMFLNLTKTKINWYIYPVVFQFAFLVAYSLDIVRDKKIVKYGLFAIIMLFVLSSNFKDGRFFKTLYSSEDDAYHIALAARSRCDKLTYLVNPDTRQANATLKSMNLTITSTEWWGDHPRVVYYFGKPVQFVYDKAVLDDKLTDIECLALSSVDINIVQLAKARLALNQKVGEMALYIKK